MSVSIDGDRINRLSRLGSISACMPYLIRRTDCDSFFACIGLDVSLFRNRSEIDFNTVSIIESQSIPI